LSSFLEGGMPKFVNIRMFKPNMGTNGHIQEEGGSLVLLTTHEIPNLRAVIT
jgi:hypothetical protein